MTGEVKKPIIFRSTPQWFCSVDAFRSELLDAVDRTKFYSEWGKPRLYNMIRDRGDWVISRQRVGVCQFLYSTQKTERLS